MRGDDARNAHAFQRGVHPSLRADVQSARALVQHEDARLAVERAGEHHPLLLAARERGTHVTHQRAIARYRSHLSNQKRL